VDFDADGIDDVITGSIYEDMYLFRGLGKGTFAKAQLLKDKDGKPLEGGYCCTTEMFDMDADGDLDLACASRIGTAKWFRNVGTRSSPEFDPVSRPLPMEKGAGSIAGSNATYADWDGDGIRDLVVGSEWGQVVWHRNLGQDNKPTFSAAQQLIKAPGFERIKEGEVPRVHGSRAKVTIVDYDQDGLLDILLGDFTSCTYSTRAPLTKKETKEKKALENELDQLQNQAYYDEINRLNKLYWAAKKAGNLKEVEAIKAKQAAMRRPADKLYSKLRPFRTTGYKSHGWVWFYRQTPARDVALTEKVLSVEPAATTEEVTLRSLASHTSVSPGQEFQVAVSFQIANGWHIYGPEKGQSYIPTTIQWELPEGMTIKNIHWPQPFPVRQGKAIQPTYKKTVTALATIVVSKDIKPSSQLTLAGNVRWQVCRELLCKLGESRIMTSVAVSRPAAGKSTSVDSR